MLEQVKEASVSAMLAFITLYAALLFFPYVLVKVMLRFYHLVAPPGWWLRGGLTGGLGGRVKG